MDQNNVDQSPNFQENIKSIVNNLKQKLTEIKKKAKSLQLTQRDIEQQFEYDYLDDLNEPVIKEQDRKNVKKLISQNFEKMKLNTSEDRIDKIKQEFNFFLINKQYFGSIKQEWQNYKQDNEQDDQQDQQQTTATTSDLDNQSLNGKSEKNFQNPSEDFHMNNCIQKSEVNNEEVSEKKNEPSQIKRTSDDSSCKLKYDTSELQKLYNEVYYNYGLLFGGLGVGKTTIFKELLGNNNFEEAQFPQDGFDKKYKKVLLLGGLGVGKTTIFKKLLGNKNFVEAQFPHHFIQKLKLIVVDTPSFNNDENLLQSQFSEFFNKEKANISTIFLILKFDRIDLMKKSFYSVIKHFGKKNLKNFKVIVTFWDLRNINEEDRLEKQLDTFFRECNIDLAGFVEKSSDRLNIENLLGRNFTRQNDLDLVDTIFEIQEKKLEQQEMISFLQNRIEQDQWLQDAMQNRFLPIQRLAQY